MKAKKMLFKTVPPKGLGVLLSEEDKALLLRLKLDKGVISHKCTANDSITELALALGGLLAIQRQFRADPMSQPRLKRYADAIAVSRDSIEAINGLFESRSEDRKE